MIRRFSWAERHGGAAMTMPAFHSLPTDARVSGSHAAGSSPEACRCYLPRRDDFAGRSLAMITIISLPRRPLPQLPRDSFIQMGIYYHTSSFENFAHTYMIAMPTAIC